MESWTTTSVDLQVGLGSQVHLPWVQREPEEVLRGCQNSDLYSYNVLHSFDWSVKLSDNQSLWDTQTDGVFGLKDKTNYSPRDEQEVSSFYCFCLDSNLTQVR